MPIKLKKYGKEYWWKFVTKFTPELLAALKIIPQPYAKGMTVDFVEFPEYLAVRLYENEIMSLSDLQRVSVMEYLHLLRNTASLIGYDLHFDGVAGDPPRRSS